MTELTPETRFSYSATVAGYAIYDAEGPRHSLPPAVVCQLLEQAAADRAALAEARRLLRRGLAFNRSSRESAKWSSDVLAALAASGEEKP